jgi:hypothetical protein
LVLKKIMATLLFVLGIATVMEFAGGATAEIVPVPLAGQYMAVLKQKGQ